MHTIQHFSGPQVRADAKLDNGAFLYRLSIDLCIAAYFRMDVINVPNFRKELNYVMVRWVFYRVF